MTLSKTTEYALRTLAHMAAQKSSTCSADFLHRELHIPKKYLQKLLTSLSRKGLITATRGRNGGYVLAKRSTRIYLSDIIDAVEGFRSSPSCFFGFKQCALENPCALHGVWTEAERAVITALSSTRLSDVVRVKHG